MGKNEKPKMVVLGGGTGMPVLLRGLKELPIDLSTIVTVADDGGSTGMLRKENKMLPAPGDIRNVISALANVDSELMELFQHRFKVNNGLVGHSLGNIVIAAMNSITGNFYEAVEQVSKMLNVQGKIYPIVNESITLHAEMEDGTIVSGESHIPMKNKKIKRVFLTPNHLKPLPEAIEAILTTDLVVISPGSLYTSILPNLIINDVIDAIRNTKAKVVYVCNIMTQNGETNDYTAADHVKAIYNHIGPNTIDTIVVHNKPIPHYILKKYVKQHSSPVQVDVDQLLKLKLEIIAEDIIDYSKPVIRHNTEKLSSILYHMVSQKL